MPVYQISHQHSKSTPTQSPNLNQQSSLHPISVPFPQKQGSPPITTNISKLGSPAKPTRKRTSSSSHSIHVSSGPAILHSNLLEHSIKFQQGVLLPAERERQPAKECRGSNVFLDVNYLGGPLGDWGSRLGVAFVVLLCGATGIGGVWRRGY